MGASLTAQRVGYRVAYRVLQVVWFVTRPNKHGVKCVVTDHDRVLLVRHTYGAPVWDLPGGSIKRRESPLSAARREMNEELGLADTDWRDIGELQGRMDHRRDTIHCFRAELSEPTLRIDPVELAAASWFDRGRLPPDLGAYVDEIMARAPATDGR